MNKSAVITGITGQDGSYLAELLLEKGYMVHGIVRRSSSTSVERMSDPFIDSSSDSRRLELHYGDLTDSASITNVILEAEPDEIYNLGCQSHVRVSFDNPVYTLQTIAVGTLAVLEAAVQLNRRKQVKVYQASSSEMYGGMPGSAPQSETTPFHPRSPYACAKAFAFHQTVNHREAYGIFACNGILFNHESPRRGEEFVTRKITRAATRIREGIQQRLQLGNLSARRDWGYAKDYVEAMWLMLQQKEPSDLVIASNETHTVEEFVHRAFDAVGLDWRQYVEIDPKLFRPSEAEMLCGDSSKARCLLRWEPKTTFLQLVQLMIQHDWQIAKREAQLESE